MANKGLGFLGTTVSGLVVVAVCAVAAYIWPHYEPAGWFVNGVKSSTEWAANALSTVLGWLSHPVPLYLPLLLALACCWFWAKTPRPQTTLVENPLSDQETEIMKLLAAADGDAVIVDVLTCALESSRLLVQQTADQLIGRELIDRRTNRYGDVELFLRTSGRNYVIAQKFVDDSLARAQFSQARARVLPGASEGL